MLDILLQQYRGTVDIVVVTIVIPFIIMLLYIFIKEFLQEVENEELENNKKLFRFTSYSDSNDFASYTIKNK